VSDFFRPPEPPPEPEPTPLQPAWMGPPENEIGVAVALRLLLARTEKVAVALTNAAAFSNVARFPGFDEPQEGPVLIQRGGGGGERFWSFGYWLWPLPPPGSLTAVVEWPSEGIPLTRVELDAAALLEAAAESEQLWPGGGPSPGGGTVGIPQTGP